MAKISYALRLGESKRLEISWKLFYRDIVVRLDGQELGSFANRKLLEAGQDFSLPDGSTLRVQLPPKTLANLYESSAPQAWLDGQPVPGSSSDPSTQLKTAAFCIFIISGFNLFLSVPLIIWQPASLGGLAFGVGILIAGVLYGVLGVFVRQRSAIALGIAFWLFVLDTLYLVWNMASASSGSGSGYQLRPNPGIFIMRFILLAGMWRGFEAIQSLKQNQTSQDSPGPK